MWEQRTGLSPRARWTLLLLVIAVVVLGGWLVRRISDDPHAVDGQLVGTVIVGQNIDCTTTDCRAWLDCAAAVVWPAASRPPYAAAVYRPPTRYRDGTLIQGAGLPVVYVAIEREDGSKVVETVLADHCAG